MNIIGSILLIGLISLNDAAAQPGGLWAIHTVSLSSSCDPADATDVDFFSASTGTCFPIGSSGFGGDVVYKTYQCNTTHFLEFDCSDSGCSQCTLTRHECTWNMIFYSLEISPRYIHRAADSVSPFLSRLPLKCTYISLSISNSFYFLI